MESLKQTDETNRPGELSPIQQQYLDINYLRDHGVIGDFEFATPETVEDLLGSYYYEPIPVTLVTDSGDALELYAMKDGTRVMLTNGERTIYFIRADIQARFQVSDSNWSDGQPYGSEEQIDFIQNHRIYRSDDDEYDPEELDEEERNRAVEDVSTQFRVTG